MQSGITYRTGIKKMELKNWYYKIKKGNKKD